VGVWTRGRGEREEGVRGRSDRHGLFVGARDEGGMASGHTLLSGRLGSSIFVTKESLNRGEIIVIQSWMRK
jgi:hypothetical protein